MAWGKGDPGRLRGRRWMAIRQRVLLRDRYRCQPCIRAGRQASPDPSNQIGHIVPRSKGGSDLDDNLETQCADCNTEQIARDAGREPRQGCDERGDPLRSDW